MRSNHVRDSYSKNRWFLSPELWDQVNEWRVLGRLPSTRALSTILSHSPHYPPLNLSSSRHAPLPPLQHSLFPLPHSAVSLPSPGASAAPDIPSTYSPSPSSTRRLSPSHCQVRSASGSPHSSPASSALIFPLPHSLAVSLPPPSLSAGPLPTTSAISFPPISLSSTPVPLAVAPSGR